MGRWYYNKKATVEASCDLTVFQLKEYGMLEGDHAAKVITWVMSNTGKESHAVVCVDTSSEPHAKLRYLVFDAEGKVTPYDTEVSLVTTPCNLGGVRYWFTCPACSRRVGGLYIAPGDYYFMCRHCANLTYNSRNRSSLFAVFGHTSRQMDKLRSEIKRWAWQGRPTRKVRRLYALQHKMYPLSVQASAWMDRFKARLS